LPNASILSAKAISASSTLRSGPAAEAVAATDVTGKAEEAEEALGSSYARTAPMIAAVMVQIPAIHAALMVTDLEAYPKLSLKK
jgi:hypothetical protein